MGRTLQIRVRGAPSVWIDGQAQDLRSRRAIALLAYLAVEDRPVPRPALAALLWGPGRRMNLRQELSRLRRLPRSDAWLDAGDEVVVKAEVIHDATAGAFLEGFEDVGTDAFQDWLAAHRTAVTSDLQTRLLRVLALEPRIAPRALAELLDVSREALADAWTSLVDHGDWVDGAVSPGLALGVRRSLAPEATRLLHGAIARAWSRFDGPPAAIAQHYEQALEHEAAAESLLLAAERSGREDLLSDALERAREPALRARIWSAICLGHRDHGRAEALQASARELQREALRGQSADALVQACLIAVLAAQDRGDLAALGRGRERLLEIGDVGDAVALLHLIDALLTLHAGRSDQALTAFERAMNRAAAVRLRVWAGNGCAAMHAAIGRVGDAERLQRRLLQEARAAGERRSVVAILANLALTVERRGDLDGAVRRLDEVLDLLRDDLSASQAAVTMKNRALLALRRAEYGLVRKLALQLEDMGAVARSRLWRLRGDLELDLGRVPEALRWYRRTLDGLVSEGRSGERQSVELAVAIGDLQLGDGAADRVLACLDGVREAGDRHLLIAQALDVGLLCDQAEVQRHALAVLDELDEEPLGRWAIRVRLGEVPARLGDPHALPQRREVVAVAAHLLDHDPSLRPALEALHAVAADGLLSTQAEALRVKMGLDGEDLAD